MFLLEYLTHESLRADTLCLFCDSEGEYLFAVPFYIDLKYFFYGLCLDFGFNRRFCVCCALVEREYIELVDVVLVGGGTVVY